MRVRVTCMSHGSCVYGSPVWVMAHVCMGHLYESRLACDEPPVWVMAHVNMSTHEMPHVSHVYTLMRHMRCTHEYTHEMPHVYTQSHQSHLEWYFRMLFQSWKLLARRSRLQTETCLCFCEKRRSSFEIWVLSFRKCHPTWDWVYKRRLYESCLCRRSPGMSHVCLHICQSPIWVVSSHEACMSHGSCVYGSPVWVMAHVCLSHLYESCLMCVWVTFMSHGSCVYGSHVWVLAHVCMGHLYESCLMCVFVSCISHALWLHQDMTHTGDSYTPVAHANPWWIWAFLKN